MGEGVVSLVPTVLGETPVSAMNKVIRKVTGRLMSLDCWDGMRSSLAKCITSAGEIFLSNKTLADHAVYLFYAACSKPPPKASLSTRAVTKMFRYVSAISSINTYCLLCIFVIQLCMFSFICSALLLEHTSDLLP